MPIGVYKHHPQQGFQKRNPYSFKGGNIPWNKGLTKETDERVAKYAKYFQGKNNPACRKKVREKISKSCRGRVAWNKNKPWSKEHRKKVSGKNSKNWRGGITPKNKLIRKGTEAKLWRKSVFERDNYICQKCLERGGKLHPHHIKNFAEHPELRFAIDNGITFDKNCHERFHKIYGKKKNNRSQVEEYLKS